MLRFSLRVAQLQIRRNPSAVTVSQKSPDELRHTRFHLSALAARKTIASARQKKRVAETRLPRVRGQRFFPPANGYHATASRHSSSDAERVIYADLALMGCRPLPMTRGPHPAAAPAAREETKLIAPSLAN